MKKTIKNEKGITLIALIITIIILVILAAVSIRTVYEMGIVNLAVNGVQDYKNKAMEENKILNDATKIIEDALAKTNNGQGGNPSGDPIGSSTGFTVEDRKSKWRKN